MILIALGCLGVGVSFLGAYLAPATGSERHQQKVRDAWGILFAISMLVLVEALLQRLAGVSFAQLLVSGSSVPYVVFIAGALLGMSYEYIWQFGLRSWHYPLTSYWSGAHYGLPIFWGIFMFIMHDTYAVLRICEFGVVSAAILTAVIQGALIEGINLLTRSWVYVGLAAMLPVLIVGWIIFLAFVFVVLFNQFVLNPFGF